MSVQTLLLDFSVDPAQLGDENGQKTVFGQLETVLKEYVPNLILAADIKLDGGSQKILTGKKGSTVSVRLFDRGLVTVNIEYYKDENEEPLINSKSESELQSQLEKYISVIKCQVYPPLKRCLFGRYYPTSDRRLLEYDIDGVVFDKQSPFQRVQIVHSKSLGNMLVLDGLQNISEADLIYTETLMQRGKENYEGKEIVILGGGDGALLYELLKEKPKHVWMLELDEMVMKACNQHLRPICGDVLETRKGPNYEIIVEDCMLTVNKFIAEGKKVDYIFGDLTDVPISEEACGELWEFMITILNASFKILKPDGKFMTHGNGATSSESLDLYEAELKKLNPPVSFTRAKAFVPSFYEDWIFYQIGFRGNQGNGDA
ncbi:spermine/spermidine synthase domain-containing protein [Phthorimaea operculella]|nr:spermine/spermidine synthase domain-containing protein [Phthorimaea operculella]